MTSWRLKPFFHLGNSTIGELFKNCGITPQELLDKMEERLPSVWVVLKNKGC